jgi:hypothetical protein
MICIVSSPRFVARVLCGLLLASAACVAQQATSSGPPTPQNASTTAKLKTNMIWTDDNITMVRTAADIHQDNLEYAGNSAAQQQPPQHLKSPQGNASGAVPSGLAIPKTEAEIDNAISTRKGWIENCKSLLVNTQERLASVSDPILRSTLEEKARLLQQDIVADTQEVRTLEKAKSDLHSAKKTQP